MLFATGFCCFDGVCNLCNGFVNFVIARDPNGKFKFAALQGTAGQAIMRSIGRDPTDHEHAGRSARAHTLAHIAFGS